MADQQRPHSARLFARLTLAGRPRRGCIGEARTPGVAKITRYAPISIRPNFKELSSFVFSSLKELHFGDFIKNRPLLKIKDLGVVGRSWKRL